MAQDQGSVRPDSDTGLLGWDTVEAYGHSHQGMVRENNQDSYCIDYETGLYMVADGMGGRAGGEVASQLAVSWINAEIIRRLDSLLTRDLSTSRASMAQAVNMASLKVYERSLELPQYRGMGTTASLLWIPPESKRAKARHPRSAIIAHVGDSRCYLARCGLLYQVTEDHSLVNEHLKSGVLKKNDPLLSQIRNVITRCVGYQEDEEIDTCALDLMRGDRFLLCSDGLTNKVNDAEIAQFLHRKDLTGVCENLVALANQRGGEDNITVVIVALS